MTKGLILELVNKTTLILEIHNDRARQNGRKKLSLGPC